MTRGRDHRFTYRRRFHYNTVSNQVKLVKVPGGGLSVHYVPKAPKARKCGDCPLEISGVSRARGLAASRVKSNKRRVTRAYGGTICANCVKDRVLRAFLIEEHRIVKSVSKGKRKQH